MISRYFIGGLDVVCDAGEVSMAEPDPVYHAFLGRDPVSVEHGTIRVILSRGVEPVPRDACLLFEAEGAWRLFGRDQERLFVHSPAVGDAQWVAVADMNRPREWRVGWSPELLEGGDGQRLRNPVTYPLDFLLMIYALVDEGLIIHGCGVKIEGRCGILTGVSGSGKSTMARLWNGIPGVEVLSDDRVIVRRIGGRLYAFGTPWLGDAGVAQNSGGPLDWIGHLTQSRVDRIRRIAPEEALPRLFRTVSVPWFDRTMLPRGLTCVDPLAGTVPQLDVAFTPSSAIVGLLRSQTDSFQSF